MHEFDTSETLITVGWILTKINLEVHFSRMGRGRSADGVQGRITEKEIGESEGKKLQILRGRDGGEADDEGDEFLL